MLFHVFVKNRLQLWVDGTLAAIHHDCNIPKFIELVELNFVIPHKGITANTTWRKVAFNIVPIQARTTNGDRSASEFLLGASSF